MVRSAAAARGGIEVDTQGDSFLLAFPIAPAALAAAAAITDGLAPGPVNVRIGLHTGTPLVTDEGYVGEDVHVAARVAAAGHGGQVLVSAATAALVTEPLLELGEHRLKDIAAPVALFQLGDGSFPPLRTLATSNLPRPASSFVGREQELQAVLARIAGGARLLTLTGPGGSGKTRLALEAGAALVTDFRAGAVWVGLASLRDPELVGETIARAVGARNGLAEHIGERRLLLVVDNFEQVVAAAPELSALVAACPNLTVVVTSRERLRVDGEVEFAVPPLAAAEAVALFCERAQLEPSDEIAELCRRLDSLPLGVELAAARASALSPAQILERLGAGLDLLRGGRDADPRQATLRATIAWSHDLLSDGERRLFHRLSVFVGGCTLDAAEQVAEADLDTLQSLVEKSLLRFSSERYSMLETIREFAAEQLDPQEGEELRARLRAFVVALAEASAPSLHTADEAAVSARLDADYANVRAAVADAFARREPDDAARILGALYPFLISHGHLGEVLGMGRGGARRPRPALGPRPRRDARRRRRDRAVRGSARPGDRAQGGAGVAPRRRLARRAAAQSEGGDARRPLRDRARPGRPRACARVRGGERGGGRRRAVRPVLRGARAPFRRPGRGGVEGPRGARRPGGGVVQPRVRPRAARGGGPPRRRRRARARAVRRRARGVRRDRRRRRGRRLPRRSRPTGRRTSTPIARAAFTAPPSGSGRREAAGRSGATPPSRTFPTGGTT